MQTDRQIETLDAFVKLVSRFGIDKTTMQDVAKEVGISVGVIYKDFKNKEDLIEAYTCRQFQQFGNACQGLIRDDLPPEQMLHDFVIGVFQTLSRLIVQDRGFMQFMQADETIKYLRCNISKRREFTKEIGSLIAQIMEKGVNADVFEIADVPKTAILFLNAFSEYGKTLMLEEQDEAKLLSGVEEMFSFLIRAVKKAS